MLSTMKDVPLSIGTIVDYGTRVFRDSEIVTYDGAATRRATFGEVGERAAQLAWALRDTLGVQIGEPVGSLMWNRQEHFEAYLAVPAMGAVLHTLNVRYGPQDIAYTSRHAEDRIVLVDDSLVDTLLQVLPDTPAMKHVVVIGSADDAAKLAGSGVKVHLYEDLLSGRPKSYEWPVLPETSAALMCYTSGTTGRPKGVVYSHRSIYLVSMQLCMGDYLALSARDRGLVVVPMFHANSWNLPFAAFMVGASMILPGSYVQPEHLAYLIETERPTISAGVPTIWSDLHTYLFDHPVDMSSLRDIVVGGSACPSWLMKAYEQTYGVHLVHGWGMTEMSPIGSIAKPGLSGSSDEGDEWAFRATQGRLVCSVQARITGPDGTILPNDGVKIGEVQTRGPWVTGSYYKQDDPSGFSDGWLRTGDIGSISPNGVLQLRDRIKDVIKSGGEWISSMELEEVLGTHPDVVEVAVIGVEDERWGERPLAIVSLSDGATADSVALAGHVAARVSRWQVPERWALVGQLPRTTAGKIDKSELRHRYTTQEFTVEVIDPPRL
jgi:fatty-acyl-CoA synthase